MKVGVITVVLIGSILCLAPALARPGDSSEACSSYVAPVFPSDGQQHETCWVARVEQDTFSDARTCQVYPAGAHHDAYPFLTVTATGIDLSVGGGERYPGSKSFIRVDDKAMLIGSAMFDKPATDAFIAQLANGKTIRSRYSEWPTGAYRDGEAASEGLPEAIAYCRSHL